MFLDDVEGSISIRQLLIQTGIGSLLTAIADQRGWCSPIYRSEGGGPERDMVSGVIPVFGPRQPVTPCL